MNHQIFENKNLQNVSSENKMMYWDAKSYLTDDILTKVDRAAMSVSLETRMPFLIIELLNLHGLPLDYKIRNGKRKIILNELLAKKVRNLIERPKMGFGILYNIG